MPTYRITDPTTGRTLRLSGDSPPTEEELNQIFSELPKPEKRSLAKAGDFAMDVLNAPSYLIGGAIKGTREQGLKGLIGGATSAVKQGFSGDYAPTIFEQLPKAIGLKEGGVPATVVGLAGELLTPSPLSVAKLLKGGSKALGLAKGVGKLGGVAEDAGRTLLEKSYKLSSSDINKIAEAIGVTKESEKAKKVIDYLEGLGMSGATRSSLSKLEDLTSSKQKVFDKLTKTEDVIDRKDYANFLLKEAIKQEKIDTPASRSLAEKLFKEAGVQEAVKGRFTKKNLSDKVSRLFKEAGESAIGDPASSNLSKRMAIAGQDLREKLVKGSREKGRELRGLVTAGEVVGSKARTGLGTQLINTFKPSAFGLGAGVGLGYATGQDPIKAGILGATGGVIANNPSFLNVAGKTLSGKFTPQISPLFSRAIEKAVDTGVRVPVFTRRESNSPQTTTQTGVSNQESLKASSPFPQLTKPTQDISSTSILPSDDKLKLKKYTPTLKFGRK